MSTSEPPYKASKLYSYQESGRCANHSSKGCVQQPMHRTGALAMQALFSLALWMPHCISCLVKTRTPVIADGHQHLLASLTYCAYAERPDNCQYDATSVSSSEVLWLSTWHGVCISSVEPSLSCR